jgi:anti-sigma-K factor RskA
MPDGPHGDAAAYVLGALPEDEHVAFVTHLETCAACREEVSALHHVVASLPAAAPQLSASEELKGRLMSTVRREAGEQAAASERAAGRDITRAPRRRPLGDLAPRAWRLAGAGALAGAGLVVVLVLALSGGGGTTVLRGRVLARGASASVRISGGHAELVLSRMPPSPSGHIYELWIKRSGAPQPTSALFDVTSAGDATVGVPGSLHGDTEVLVTAEPLGGSKVPTSSPVVIAPVS